MGFRVWGRKDSDLASRDIRDDVQGQRGEEVGLKILCKGLQELHQKFISFIISIFLFVCNFVCKVLVCEEIELN